MSQSFVPYDGYPQPAGAKLESAGDLFGPSNYQSGGYNINFQTLGFYGRIEHISGSASQSNNYVTRFHFPANSSVANETRATGAANATVLWYAANGTEVANNSNLSAEVVQVYARGI